MCWFFFEPEDSLHYWYKSAGLDLYLASPTTTRQYLIQAAKQTRDAKSEEHSFADAVSYYLRDLKRYSEFLVSRLQILDQLSQLGRVITAVVPQSELTILQNFVTHPEAGYDYCRNKNYIMCSCMHQIHCNLAEKPFRMEIDKYIFPLH